MTTQEISGLAHNKRVVTIVVAAVVAVILLAAFISGRNSRVPVRADRAVRGNIANTISTNGKIEPVDGFEAHAPAPITVKRVLVHEGDLVKRGQLLVQLDDGDARAQAARALAQLRAAEADLHAVGQGGTREEVLTTKSQLVKAQGDLEAARRNLEAMKRLQENGAASAAEVEAAQNQYDSAQAQVSLLQQKLSQRRYSPPEVEKVQAQAAQAKAAYEAAQELVRETNIVAPKDGEVYNLPVHEGAFVTTGDLVIQVADLSSVQVRAFVDEPDLGRLATGERVRVTWDGLPGRTWDGVVTRVPTTVTTRGTRTVGEVTCEIQNRDLKLIPNVNVGVSVITARHDNVLTVPREAVHQSGGQHYVFVIADNELKRHDVQIGISDLTRIEIAGDIPENTPVALGSVNGQALRNELPVKVVQR